MAVTLSERAIIKIGGSDTLTFLQGLCTQDITRLSDTPCLFSAMLSAQGKFLYDFFLYPHDAGCLLDIDQQQADDLLAIIKRYKLRSDVTLTRADEDYVVQAEWDASHTDMENCAEGNAWHPDPRHPVMGWRRVIPSGEQRAPVGDEAYDAHRLRHAIPDGAKDGCDRFFLLEMGYDALHAVSFTKGCYVGQEPTARMHYRHVLRKCFFAVESSEEQPLPAPGTAIMAGEKNLGQMRSSRGPVGLALCRIEPVELAQQQELPILADEVPVRLVLPNYMHSKIETVKQAQAAS